MPASRGCRLVGGGWSTVELRVLGPLEVRVDGVAVPLGPPKQQTVLALLAVNAGRVVGLDDLVDELWPESPPASAIENTRSYAASVRRLFDSVDPGRNRVARRSSGYVLAVSPDELDLFVFIEECRRGRAAMARRDLPTAARLLASAQERWCGRMLTGVPRGPVLTARCAAMEEERLVLAEDQAELELALDQPSRGVVALREHARAHPLRERGQALLVRALYQAGDVAGALTAYTSARAALVDQLGIEPGPELQRVHAAVLNRELEQALSSVTGSTQQASAASTSAPRELPPDLGCFVGREDEATNILATLSLQEQPAHPRPIVITLYGQGGVGKSALAVHVAHRAAVAFPDGQLYVDLLGSTPGLRPMAPIDALCRFLRSLGVPQDQMPTDAADATAQFRTVTSRSQLLVVLDNAMDVRQVLPLLPASGACGVLVTAREPFTALDAEYRLHTPTLSRDDGISLLRRVAVGVPLDGSAAGRIVDLCERLPLAIRIAAGRLIGRPDLPPDQLAERLTDRRRRLDELEESGGVGVRSSIRVGYESLLSGDHRTSELAARAFRALGVLNVPDVDIGVVSAMLSEPADDIVRAALDRLVAVQLLSARAGGRYRFHDLVRLAAAEQAEHDYGTIRDDVLHRAIAYYAGSLIRAESLLRPGRINDFGTPPVPPDIRLPYFREPVAAWEWMQAEFENLLAAAEQVSELPEPAHRYAVLICHSTWYNLFRHLEWRNARRLGPLLHVVAQRHHDQNMEGWAHLLTGQDLAEQGEIDTATEHFERALALLRDTDDDHGVAVAKNNLGIAQTHRGDFVAGATHYAQSIGLARKIGAEALATTVLYNLGNLQISAGDWDEARITFEKTLSAACHRQDSNASCRALSLLATVNCHRGDLSGALSNVEEALASRLR
ncbi:MAG TPA: hypothetical protein DGG94_00770 [Micromonosporaceae bacterium]|nr:hypothetical protein [Micromonosporaceae bacterium]